MNRADDPSDAWLADPEHPICCDTSALYHPTPLRQLRHQSPDRRIILPMIAYFERQRQIRVRLGKDYHSAFLRQNLLEPLAIEIVLCEEPVAVFLAQMAEQVETRALSTLVDDGADLTWHNRRDLIQHNSRNLRSQQV